MSKIDATQADAFKVMAIAGRSKAELAAKFGITQQAVHQRMRRMGLFKVEEPKPPEFGPVKLTEALAFHCRFCVEPESALPHAEMLVCGKRVIDGKSWCPDHARLVWSREGSSALRAIDRGPGRWRTISDEVPNL